MNIFSFFFNIYFYNQFFYFKHLPYSSKNIQNRNSLKYSFSCYDYYNVSRKIVKKSKFNLLFILLAVPCFLNAQHKDTVKYVKKNLLKNNFITRNGITHYNQEDLIDVYRFILHKDMNTRKYTYEHKHIAGKPHISVLPAAGYTLTTGFAGVISNNIAFYTSDSTTQKISSIFTSVAYTQHNQIILPIHFNLWTKGNKYNIVTEWRYMKFPSPTYGLGGSTLLKDGYNIDFSDLKLHQTIYKSISKNLYAGFGYFFDYFWNISETKPPANTVTDFEKYGVSNSESSSGIALRLLYDSRLNQINPRNGFYANVVLRPNFTFLGSQNNWQSLLLEFRKYIKFSKHSKNVLAFWSYNWLTTGGKTPYLMLPSTGWDDAFNTGRGYIQGRFRGNNMLYMEAEYRFGILHNGLIGGVIFANTQSFSSGLNKEIVNMSPAFGTGLRIKLNKFSGANLCIDYGIGIDGSNGFFVNLGEVF